MLLEAAGWGGGASPGQGRVAEEMYRPKLQGSQGTQHTRERLMIPDTHKNGLLARAEQEPVQKVGSWSERSKGMFGNSVGSYYVGAGLL